MVGVRQFTGGMLIHLSRLMLNLRNKQALAELNNIYELHRTIMSAFPDNSKGGPGRVLFRIEDGTESFGKAVLIQSQHKPDWNYLRVADDYLVREPESKEFNPKISIGVQYRFRLLANPTVKKDGKRLGIFDEEEQVKWITRKSESNGFTLLNVMNYQKEGVKGFKPGQQNGIVLHSVLFEGALRVDDVEKFLRCLEGGIGSGKGFGFGLISLARGSSDGQGLPGTP